MSELITNPTAANFLQNSQTIKHNGVDTKILEIYPVGRVIKSVPADITVIFSEAVEDIVITNEVDKTEIDKNYIAYYADTAAKYPLYDKKGGWLGTQKDNIYVLTFKYFFTDHNMVRFILNYNDTDGNAIEYPFWLHNETPIAVGSYILPRDKQP